MLSKVIYINKGDVVLQAELVYNMFCVNNTHNMMNIKVEIRNKDVIYLW